MKKKLVTIILLSTLSTQAQIGGEYVYQFLNLPTSPLVNALGGNNVTTYGSNPNQVLHNPASLNESMAGQFNVNYGNFYGEIHLGSASYAKKMKNGRNIHIGITYLNYGTMDGYDEMAQYTGTFSGNDVAISAGYAHQIQNTDFYIGSNIKFISSSLENYSSMGIAADIGAMYVNENSGWTAGMVVKNIGTQLSNYNGENEKMPITATLGISKQLENVPIRWHLTMENLQKWKIAFSNPNRTEQGLDGTKNEERIGALDHALRHLIVGADIFTNKNFNVKLAYNFRRGEEMKLIERKSFAGFSFGFGLKVNRIRFEYSHSRVTLAGNSHLLGLSVKL